MNEIEPKSQEKKNSKRKRKNDAAGKPKNKTRGDKEKKKVKKQKKQKHNVDRVEEDIKNLSVSKLECRILLTDSHVEGSGVQDEHKEIESNEKEAVLNAKDTNAETSPKTAINVSHKEAVEKNDFRDPSGSYRDYYQSKHAEGRGGTGKEDPRLPLLKKEWIEGKSCLDIGCNTGDFTAAIVTEYQPSSMLGVDIDSGLIDEAKKSLIRLRSSGENKGASLVPRILKSGSSGGQQPVTNPRTEALKKFNFICGDITDDNLKLAESYDVITCFSTIKWIHLNGGDDVLKKLFSKIYCLLNPGGKFILEPQKWNSYSKNKHSSEQSSKIYSTIKFMPYEFESYLLSSEVGFASMVDAGVPKGVSKGFRRHILVFTK